MNLTCPKCGHKFNSEAKRPQCSKCKYNFPRIKFGIETSKTSKTSNQTIQDNILNGNILDALDQTKIDPFNDQKMFKDFIPLLLGDNETRYAFARACDERRKSPRVMVKVIIKSWLKEKGFL